MQPEAAEPGRMQRFTAALLRHEDALVEPIEPEGLEVLAPPPVQQALGIGELARLGFGATLPPGAQRVGIEGDWLDRFARLLGPRGRWMRQVITADTKAPGDPERALAHELVLDNATYRLQDVTAAWARYLVMDFRASAVSDDKRDLIVRLGANLATGSLPDAILAALSPMLDRPPSDEDESAQPSAPQAALPPLWDHDRLEALVQRALPPRLQAALAPFVKGMQRRLARDQDRLYRYHNDLYHEAMHRAIGLPKADPKRTREEQRAEAIRREYRAKLDDLERQYATRVTVEWVQTLELVMPVHRFAVQIRRRKADRMISLDWNPVARRLEPPVCEATFGMERPRLVCDDKLHLVVPAGLAPCVNCGRPFCRACHGGRCPKCGTDGQMV
ncbi:MAG: hypothetical protein ACJ8AW_15750 [Rhodopila sp.]